MKTSLLTALSLAALSLTAASASATISSVAGATTQLTFPNPASAFPGALTGPNAYAWDEQQNRFAQAFPVDMINNGPHTGAIPGVLNGFVNSHFIAFEEYSGVIVTAVGSVTYNEPIVGVNFYNASLDSTDPIFGAPLTSYPTFYPARDLTFNSSAFSVSGNTINFALNTLSPIYGVTHIRVFTQIPTPGAASLAGLGVLAGLRLRRR
jgi:hypothetical protein